jgi:chromate transporter
MNWDWQVLLQIVLILAPLSFVAVGGGNTAIPEIHRQVVEARGWLTSTEFAELFALAQLSPGPNLLVVSLIGWKVAGFPGGLVALLAMTGPSSLLAYAVARLWQKLGGVTWLLAIRAGLAPIAIGLVLSSGFILATGAATTPVAYLVTAATVLILLRTGVHPLLLMAGGAALAVAGWI